MSDNSRTTSMFKMFGPNITNVSMQGEDPEFMVYTDTLNLILI